MNLTFIRSSRLILGHESTFLLLDWLESSSVAFVTHVPLYPSYTATHALNLIDIPPWDVRIQLRKSRDDVTVQGSILSKSIRHHQIHGRMRLASIMKAKIAVEPALRAISFRVQKDATRSRARSRYRIKGVVQNRV